jgi:uncharacterized protein YndB with AHSA1/START domain
MNKNLIAKASVSINSDPANVWKGLTDPTLIKQYFFGTEAKSAWKKGSSLVFTGEWQGTKYEDRGTILEIDPPQYLKYSYWSSFSGKPDVPENYANISYTLVSKGKGTELTVTQDGLATDEAVQESLKNWHSVLDGLKKLLEEGSHAVV